MYSTSTTWASLSENVAENVRQYTREMQDEIALASQQKAAAAIANGRFKDEIVPIEVKKKKETVILIPTSM